MVNKRYIVFYLILVLFVSSGYATTMPYEFVRREYVGERTELVNRNDDKGGGYVVAVRIGKGRRLLPYFTVGNDKNYPQDLHVAQKRFNRRKRFVEDWYKKYEPGYNKDPGPQTLFLGIVLFPLGLPAAMLADSGLSDMSHKDWQDWQKRQKELREVIWEFIAEDCKTETLNIENKEIY